MGSLRRRYRLSLLTTSRIIAGCRRRSRNRFEGRGPGAFVYPPGLLKPATLAKIAAVAIVALLFGGLALRAAMRLVNTATHSLFFGVVLLVLVVWIVSSRRRPN